MGTKEKLLPLKGMIITMPEILETIMLVCFGISWPLTVYKSYKIGTAKGMSQAFILMIMCGYVAGITAKILSGRINYVLAAYIINLIIVSADLAVYYRNRHLDKMRENANGTAKACKKSA